MIFQRIVFFLVLLCLAINANAQKKIEQFIQENFKGIYSIDTTNDNFSDLACIKDAIGNSRVVLLGEQDHGDAPTFLAKIKLIKFLHEHLGFDILAFESDFWSLNTIDVNALAPEKYVEEVKGNIYSIWSKCLQTQELYRYIIQTLQTKNPLLISGIDCRHSSVLSKEKYVKAVTSFLQTHNYSIKDSSSFINILKELITKEYHSNLTEKEKFFFLNSLQLLVNNVKDDFWQQEFINLSNAALNAFAKHPENSIIRDTAMANNLMWLLSKKYKDKKVIVWSHSGHVAKNIALIPGQNSTSFGNELYKLLGSEVYILGFTSHQGTAGRISVLDKFEIEKPKLQSFESWVNKLNYNFGFINFRTIRTDELFYMKGLFHKSEKGSWTNVFDGMFYIKNMYPCDKVD